MNHRTTSVNRPLLAKAQRLALMALLMARQGGVLESDLRAISRRYGGAPRTMRRDLAAMRALADLPGIRIEDEQVANYQTDGGSWKPNRRWRLRVVDGFGGR